MFLLTGLDAGERLGIEPIFQAKEMADPEVEHLGIMAYAAYYTKLQPIKLNRNAATFDGNLDTVYVGKEVGPEFDLHFVLLPYFST